MKILLVAVICAILPMINCWPNGTLTAFDAWKKEFNITMDFACELDENRAVNNFLHNKLKIDEHNHQYEKCNGSYGLGLWENSHLSDVEMNKLLNGLDDQPTDDMMKVEERTIYIRDIPILPPIETDFSWASEGAVTPVRNQLDCACCYSFAATGAMEGQIFIKNSSLQKLSDQQIVDCSKDPKYGNNGCSRGSFEGTYKYIKDNGIALGRNYPYIASESPTCQYNPSMKAADITDFRRIRVKSDDFLRDLVYSIGPLAVGVNSSLFTFLNYKEGVYSDPDCSGNINHAMLLVGFGYDIRYGEYWILKNSFGKSWGELGYIKMSREIPNFCGIWNYVTFPFID